jgi:hypothetical protein
MVTFFARTKRDIATKAQENLEREPDSAWVQGLVGTYTNAGLGTVQISAGSRAGIYDVGEWKSAFARRKEEDGTTKLVLVDPPFAGGESIIGGDDQHPTPRFPTVR